MGDFPFPNNPKNLDPYFRMDLDFWDSFEPEFFLPKQLKYLDSSYKMDLDFWNDYGKEKLL